MNNPIAGAGKIMSSERGQWATSGAKNSTIIIAVSGVLNNLLGSDPSLLRLISPDLLLLLPTALFSWFTCYYAGYPLMDMNIFTVGPKSPSGPSAKTPKALEPGMFRDGEGI